MFNCHSIRRIDIDRFVAFLMESRGGAGYSIGCELEFIERISDSLSAEIFNLLYGKLDYWTTAFESPIAELANKCKSIGEGHAFTRLVALEVRGHFRRKFSLAAISPGDMALFDPGAGPPLMNIHNRPGNIRGGPAYIACDDEIRRAAEYFRDHYSQVYDYARLLFEQTEKLGYHRSLVYGAGLIRLYEQDSYQAVLPSLGDYGPIRTERGNPDLVNCVIGKDRV